MMKKNPEKSLKPWYVGSHLTVLCKGFPVAAIEVHVQTLCTDLAMATSTNETVHYCIGTTETIQYF